NANNLQITVDEPGDYKVMLIAADGIKSGQSNEFDAYLSYYGSYIVSEKHDQVVYEGNLIKDPSATGEVDVSNPGTKLFLGSVTYKGVVYNFGSSNAVIIDTDDGGKLIVQKDGSYKYFGKPGDPGAFSELNMEYTVQNSLGNSDTATLHAPDPNVTAYNNEANPVLWENAGVIYDQRLGYFTNPTNSLGIPTGNAGASGASVLSRILAGPNSGVTSSNANQIVIRANGNIDAYMPLKADGTLMTMKELFETHRVNTTTDTYQDAGFITLPTFTVYNASTVVVRWYWDGGSNTTESDIAMWVLVDATGKVVKSGRFAQGDAAINSDARNLYITVDEPGDYKVMLIAADGGKNGGGGTSDTELRYYGSFIMSGIHDQVVYEGNLITDPSGQGQVDTSAPSTPLFLGSVTYKGVVYNFGNFNAVTIDTDDGGKLIVYKDGTYKYFGKVGDPGAFSGLDLEYTVHNSLGSSDTATLHAPDPHVTAYDNEADLVLVETGKNYDYRLTGFTSPTNTDGIPVTNAGNSAATVQALIMGQPYAGLVSNGTANIVFSAQANINPYMPLKADGTQQAIAELFDKHKVTATDRFQDAGFITLPSFTVNSASKIAINWSWTSNANDADIGMWVLVDATGKIVDSGRFAQGGTTLSNRTLYISVQEPGDYKVMLIAADGGKNGSNAGVANGQVTYLGSYIVSEKHDQIVSQGNLITDQSSHGQVDSSAPSTTLFLGSVTYKGVVYTFGNFNAVTIDTDDGGRLIVYKDGNYKYFGKVDDPGAFNGLDLDYTVQNALGSSDSASLHASVPDVMAYDNEGMVSVTTGALPILDYRLTSFTAPSGNALGVPTGGSTNAIGLTVRDTVLSNPNVGVYNSGYDAIIVRATSNIDGYMPFKADGSSRLTMKDLFQLSGTDPNEYKEAGFITLPTFSVTSASTIVVRFYWKGGAAANETDAAFWVLVDGNGRIVKSEKFASGGTAVNSAASNLNITVDVPGDYKLMLIAADGVKAGVTLTGTDADLRFYGAYIVPENHAQIIHTGNLITDDISSIAAKLSVASVNYAGVDYALGSASYVTINTADGGHVQVYKDGTYKYFGMPDHPESFQGLDLQYTVQDTLGNTETANLYLRDKAHTFTGAAGEDIFTGTAGDDLMYGHDGNDTLRGGHGNDILHGGKGNDTL
ncbi:MAG: hypothetical protein ACRDD3_12565, partial [Azovibrio sp.]